MAPGTRADPYDIPEFSVIEDSPRRLVLQVGASRLIPGIVLAVFAVAALAVWWLERDWWGMLPVSALFLAGGVFFAMHRPRWTFDAERGTVRFDSPWRRRWEAPLAAVTRLTLVSRADGRAGEEITTLRLMMTVKGHPKPMRVNASFDPSLVREQQQRIEAMIAPWRRLAAPPDGPK